MKKYKEEIMTHHASNQILDTETDGSNWKSLYTIGGIAVLLQLVILLVIMIVSFNLGPEPGTPEEYFEILQADRLVGLLQIDFTSLMIVALYLGYFPGLYIALRRVDQAYSALATLFTFIGVTVVFATHSGLSMLFLGDQYAAATTQAQRSEILAAGRAVIASDMWNSSGGYMAGMLLQGSGVLISLIMLRSKDFSKVTAYAGLLGNAFDLAQHLIHPFAPSISAPLLLIAGPFYLVWFPWLGRDLFRLRRDS